MFVVSIVPVVPVAPVVSVVAVHTVVAVFTVVAIVTVVECMNVFTVSVINEEENGNGILQARSENECEK